MKSIFALIVFTILLAVTLPAFAQVHVRGYTRSNGTYVQPHMRSAPDGNAANNWSTRGNVNPYTGAVGTRSIPNANSGQFQQPSFNSGYGGRESSYQ